MNNYVENDTFEFGNKEGTFDYNSINGLNNSQNENLFNTEVSNSDNSNVFQVFEPQINQINTDVQSNVESMPAAVMPSEVPTSMNSFENNGAAMVQNVNPSIVQENVIPSTNVFQPNNEIFNNQVSDVPVMNPFVVSESTNLINEVKQEIVEPQTSSDANLYAQMPTINLPEAQETGNLSNSAPQISEQSQVNTDIFNDSFPTMNPFVVPESLNLVNEAKEQLTEPTPEINNFSEGNFNAVEKPQFEVLTSEVPEEEQSVEPFNTLEAQEPINLADNTPVELIQNPNLENTIVTEVETTPLTEIPIPDVIPSQEVEVPDNENVQEPVIEQSQESSIAPQESVSQTIPMSNEDLSSLTEFKEDKMKTTDIKSLFDRVGINVKEASDIFKRNTEMKDKIDSRFDELKKLQSEVSKVRQAQYDEINAYKEEVLGKLTEKKDEIEIRLNKLKEFQTALEKEKVEFEQYRKKQKEEIERVQKEVQDAYDSRREELKRIEDVLRKQKDSLDEERNQLSLDRIQYESDKNELANNLLKFNEIVDSFTNGIDKIDKE